MMQFTWATDLDPVAVVAAALALASLLWQVISYVRQGPRIRLSVMADAIFIDDAGETGSGFLLLTAKNVGTAPTTVTHMVLFWYSNRLIRLLDVRWLALARRALWNQFEKRHKSMLVKDPSYGSFFASGTVPSGLPAGQQWQGILKYDDKLLQLRNQGFLYVAVYHSMNERPEMIRVPTSSHVAKTG